MATQLNKKVIFVTGATGTVGSAIIKLLSNYQIRRIELLAWIIESRRYSTLNYEIKQESA